MAPTFVMCAKKAGKGKDYSDPNNWRGICLAEIPAKIQSSIISNRLLLHLEMSELKHNAAAFLEKVALMPFMPSKLHFRFENNMAKTHGPFLLIWSKHLTQQITVFFLQF
jgi:hypothetical protein